MNEYYKVPLINIKKSIFIKKVLLLVSLNLDYLLYEEPLTIYSVKKRTQWNLMI